jgi:hypothetical protein
VENTPLITIILTTLLGGGAFGILINQLFLRPKTIAEARKLDAEADRAKAETSKLNRELNLGSSQLIESPGSDEIKGWDKWGEDPRSYEIGIDRNERYRGKPSGYIKSIAAPKGFGSFKQAFRANMYQGKRLKMTGCAKSNSVEEWAGLWMRIDGPLRTERSLGFDNMEDRPIKGTTGWTRYQIVLDVPENGAAVAFGVLLVGSGQLWATDFQFEIVDSSVPTTPSYDYPGKPLNLNFDE